MKSQSTLSQILKCAQFQFYAYTALFSINITKIICHAQYNTWDGPLSTYWAVSNRFSYKNGPKIWLSGGAQCQARKLGLGLSQLFCSNSKKALRFGTYFYQHTCLKLIKSKYQGYASDFWRNFEKYEMIYVLEFWPKTFFLSQFPGKPTHKKIWMCV